MAFSPDGRTVVASDSDRNIRVGLGRGQTGRVLVDRDFGVAHNRDVTGLEVHPNGSLLVSGSLDNTLKIWDLAADQLLFKMTVLTESVVVPAFGPDGRILAISSSEGTTLYDVLGLDAMTSEAIQDDPVRDFAFVNGARGRAIGPRYNDHVSRQGRSACPGDHFFLASRLDLAKVAGEV